MMNKKLFTSVLLVLLMAGMTSAVSVGTPYDSNADLTGSELVSQDNVVIENGTVAVNDTANQGVVEYQLDVERMVDDNQLSSDNFALMNAVDLTSSDGTISGNSITVNFLDENGDVDASDQLENNRVDFPSQDVQTVEFVLNGEATMDSFSVEEVSNDYLRGEIVNFPMSVSDNGVINPDDQREGGEVTYAYGKWVLLEEGDEGDLTPVDESQWQELTMNELGNVELESESLAQGFLQPSPFERHFDTAGDYAYSLVLAEAHSEFEDTDGDGEPDTWVDPNGESTYDLFGETVTEEAGTYNIQPVDKKTYKFSVSEAPAPTSPTSELQKFFNDILRGLYSIV